MGKYLISYEKRMKVLNLLDKGLKAEQIASQCGVSVSSVRNIGAGGIEVAERAKAQQEAKAKVVKFERSAEKIKGRSRLTEEQLKTWAYIHQRYGKNKEEKDGE